MVLDEAQVTTFLKLRKTSFRELAWELVTFQRGNVTRSRTNPGRERETDM